MLVYGDRSRREDPRETIGRLRADLSALPARPGIERHAALVSALIAAGELAQGIADAEFEAAGEDTLSPVQDSAMRLVTALARAIIASWDSGFAAEPPTFPELDALEAADLPTQLTLKQPEGYAFYALYPAAYAEAARPLAPSPETKVIGLRSIGTSLAAMVAARLGAEAPVTVRPTGHPFARELKPSEGLRSALAQGERFAVVDEGPGLSGSSFGAAADLLAREGGGSEEIAYFPGHPGGLGPQASPARRRWWDGVERHVVSFDQLVLQAADPAHRLESWVFDLTGEALQPLQDISGGAWRELVYDAESHWPPANAGQERRKFLLRSASGTWLLKFAGLGRAGARKLASAQALASAGFAPEVLGVRHGFLVERWETEAKPLGPGLFPRQVLIERLSAYLRLRARALPAEPDSGASIAELYQMARVNTAEALGESAAERLEAWRSALPALQARVRRVETDNRMHLWEWRLTPDGRLLKTDAVDHAHGHDLIGCQDIAWDVAGAGVEFGLSVEETDHLAGETGADPELLAFFTPCYLAFQLGAYAMAADAHAGWPEEQARLGVVRDRYTTGLDRLLRRA